VVRLVFEQTQGGRVAKIGPGNAAPAQVIAPGARPGRRNLPCSTVNAHTEKLDGCALGQQQQSLQQR